MSKQADPAALQRATEEFMQASRDYVALLQAALEPLAALQSSLRTEWPDTRPLYSLNDAVITVGDVRRAWLILEAARG